MRQKKIPLRKCTGCGEMKEKKQLVRIVKAPESAENKISVDTKGKMPGRGAYLCKNTECLFKARKARRLEKTFSCKIPDEIYEQLERELKEKSEEEWNNHLDCQGKGDLKNE